MNKINEFISTGLYIGYFPTAPGTFGSFTAVLIAWIIQQFTGYSWIAMGVGAMLSFTIGLFTVSRFLKDSKEKDPGYIVIDEWAGQFTTYCFVPLTIETLIIGFIFFRIFDITKIFPINKTEKLKGALGVMADDVVAGIYAGVCLYIAHLFIK